MLTYTDLGRHLHNLGVETNANEVHGLLTGLVAAGKQDPDRLLTEISGFGNAMPSDTAADREALRDLVTNTVEQFRDPTFIFSPLLPGEEESLKDRAAALRDWCEGFLYGLGLGEANQASLPEEVVEAVEDMGEFTRLDAMTIGDSEEEEQALADLIEYVRAAVMTINDVLTQNPANN